jgi:archaetidylinositol phosphate synthase
MLEEKRNKFEKISKIAGEVFSKLGLTPNQYTLLSVFFAIFCFLSLIKGFLVSALIFLIIATILDFIDGAVARFTGKETKRGAYLDTVCDRYVEGLILLGFIFLPLPDFFLGNNFWIFLSVFGGLMTTYAKAAAKEKELIEEEMKKGFLGRPERTILIGLAVFFGIFNLSWLIHPIVFLAVFSNLTAFQRIYLAFKSNKK